MADRRTRQQLEREAVNFEDLLKKNSANKPTTSQAYIAEQQKRLTQPSNVVVDRFDPKNKEPRTGNQNDVARTQEQLALQQFMAQEQAQNAQRLQRNTATKAADTSSTAAGVATGAGASLVSRSVFFWMMGWHWWQWTTLQLALGLVSTMFLGLAYSLESSWLGRRINDIAGAANAVTSFVGLDFSQFSPENMFFVLYIFLLGILWLSVFATVVVYMCVQHKALSGNATGLKYGMVLLALIGYAIPVANLFPWIFAYILVMKKYPK